MFLELNLQWSLKKVGVLCKRNMMTATPTTMSDDYHDKELLLGITMMMMMMMMAIVMIKVIVMVKMTVIMVMKMVTINNLF